MFTAERLPRDRWAAAIVSGPQAGAEGSIVQEVRARDIPLTIEPSLVREPHPLRDPIAFVRLMRFIKKNKFDIVHTHSSKAGFLARWAAHFARVPIIVHTVHGWGFHDAQPGYVQALYVFLEKITERITDRLIVVADSDRDKGLAAGIGRPGKYQTIRSAIDIGSYAHPQRDARTMKAELGIPEDRKVVCSVTRLSPQKDPLTMIDVAGRVCEARSDVHFLIVGDGPTRGELEHAIRRGELGDRVTLTGLRRDIPELLGCSDVFVLTSLWEGLPRVFLQAMAAGLPVVATRTGGSASRWAGSGHGLSRHGRAQSSAPSPPRPRPPGTSGG